MFATDVLDQESVHHDWLTGEVLPHWLQWYEQGLNPVLATLVKIEGSSPRPLGAQMAIVDHERWTGFLSGGCIETALIAEAIAARDAKRSKTQRYGVGSPYIDLALPCGSAIDIYFDVHFPVQLAKQVLACQQQRQACSVCIDYQSHQHRICKASEPVTQHSVIKTYQPQIQVVIVGLGPVVLVMAQLAKQLGLMVKVLAADQATHDALIRACAVDLIEQVDKAELTLLDEGTAIVTLYHEHERETPVLDAALSSRAFYIAALGSRRSHEERIKQLTSMGHSEQACRRIHGPAGLFHSARNPRDMAMSILAQLLQQHHALQQS